MSDQIKEVSTADVLALAQAAMYLHVAFEELLQAVDDGDEMQSAAVLRVALGNPNLKRDMAATDAMVDTMLAAGTGITNIAEYRARMREELRKAAQDMVLEYAVQQQQGEA